MENIHLLLLEHLLQEKMMKTWINSAGMVIGMKENGPTIVLMDLLKNSTMENIAI